MKSFLTNRHVQMAIAVLVGLALWAFGHQEAGTAAMLVGATLPLNGGAVTLLDYAKSVDPNGRTARVIELLGQTNEILLDMPFIEGNLPTGHRTTVRTGLPAVTWRQLYGGVAPSKSVRAQVDDTVGMLETRSEVDVDLLKLNKDQNAFRLSEAQAFLEAMNQAMADTLIYGNVVTNPERFTGLAPRYSSLSAGNGTNIIDAGGTGSNNTSIWLVVWGENTCHGIYPQGSEAGLLHEDLGVIDAFDSNNNRFRAAAERWQWKAGISLRDWRYAVRIANINVTDLAAQTGTQAPTAATSIIRLMLRATQLIPFMGMGKPVFYANRTAKTALAQAAMSVNSAFVGWENAANQLGAISPGSAGSGAAMNFLKVPVRTVDRIINTEARVV